MLNQEKFLKGVNQKNPKAWKELYRYFYGALCNHLTGIVKDTTIAADIVQESLITIWNSAVYFPEMKALSVYLYRSCHNNALKYLRDRNVNNQHLQKWNNEQDEVEEAYFYQAVEEELIRKLRVAISRLPSQRQTIILLSLDGLTVQEIAAQLNISPNTVKTQKKRAYSSLKKQLEADLILLIFIHILQ